MIEEQKDIIVANPMYDAVFKANYFVDKKFLKKYVYRITENETDKILKKMIAKLQQIAADPYARREMEEEEFMAMNIDFWKRTIVNKDSIISAVSAELAQRDKELVQTNKERDIDRNTIAQRDKELAQTNKELAQRDKELAQKDKALEEYMRRYGKLNGAIN